MAMRKSLRILGWTLAVLLVVLGLGTLWLHSHIRSSLPQLDGEATVAGLAATVTIDRDAQGVPTIRGANRLDVARATGYVHAQDRFFQMDLIRRQSAGELAELVGSAALGWDRSIRRHRFRSRAITALVAIPEPHREILTAYAEGANAGLASLDAPPFEYLMLRAEPHAWRPEDTILVLFAMYIDLQDDTGRGESAYGVAHDVLPHSFYEFLTPRGTEWDAPMTGEPFAVPATPSPEEVDLRQEPPAVEASKDVAALSAEAAAAEAAVFIGSNNWAVAGMHTPDGTAILANDMHLGHAVPNIWYRAALIYPEGDGERRVVGVSLPGTPVVVAGSNGEVAWGFTNSQGDWTDLVVLETVPGDDDAYLTPEGARPFERHREEIRVHGGDSETLEIVETIWGPVIDEDHQGRQRVLRWVAHDIAGANLGQLDLETASSIEEAMLIANQVGAPAQNFTIAGDDGRIGWTLMGPIPRRFGYQGRLPTSWADGSRGWDGYLTPEEYPRIIDPEGGHVWTANARVASGEDLAKLGYGSYALGARARQIRDDLRALGRVDEKALLGVQLDDRSLFLERWRGLLLAALDEAAVAADPRRHEMRGLVLAWNGRASVDAIGHRLVRGFRGALEKQVFESLTARCKAADERFSFYRISQREGPLWQLLSERPPHLLNRRFRNWDEQILAAVDALLDELGKRGSNLAERTWGERNTVRVRHPLSGALPGFLAGWLDMEARQLPGDSFMPRVQSRGFGASERMVVSPGREETGIFHMPTGQSGHPLSPHYGDGHAAWMAGEATPFLPGETVHALRLTP
jgi:penicillin amidase